MAASAHAKNGFVIEGSSKAMQKLVAAIQTAITAAARTPGSHRACPDCDRRLSRTDRGSAESAFPNSRDQSHRARSFGGRLCGT